METTAAERLALLVFQFALLSGILKLAVDNVKAARINPSWWPEVTLVIGVVVCIVFDFRMIQTIVQTMPRSLFGMLDGGYADNVFTGLALAGGAGGIADILRDAAKQKKIITEAKDG